MAEDHTQRLCKTKMKIRLQSAAREAVLTDPDLLLTIAWQHGRNTRGACRDFFLFAEVCKQWMSAAQTTDVRMASWTTLKWTIKNFSGRKPGDEFVKVFDQAPYDWELHVLPCVKYCLQSNESTQRYQLFEVRLACRRTDADLDPETRPKRRIELHTTLHHATDPSKSRSKFVRQFATDGSEMDARLAHCRQGKELRTRLTHTNSDGDAPHIDEKPWMKYPCRWMKYPTTLAETTELLDPRSDFLADGALTVSVRVRVHPGRLQCGSGMNSAVHALRRQSDLPQLLRAVHPLDQYGSGTYRCDVCLQKKALSELHRCSRGCNFDVCRACLRPLAYRLVDGMSIGWGCSDRPLPELEELS